MPFWGLFGTHDSSVIIHICLRTLRGQLVITSLLCVCMQVMQGAPNNRYCVADYIAVLVRQLLQHGSVAGRIIQALQASQLHSDLRNLLTV
jgi:hypothetical protein